MSEIMWCLSFCVWLISLNIMSSRSTHVVTNNRISSFLWLTSIPQYIRATFSLSSYPLLDTNVAFISWLL
jgi:hypothetical protein